MEWFEMFIHWRSQFPFSRNKDPMIMRWWMKVTKYLFWSLWLCRNQVIFQDSKISPTTKAIKGTQLIFEAISVRGFDDSDLDTLMSNEKYWLKKNATSDHTINFKTYKTPFFCISLFGERFVYWQWSLVWLHFFSMVLWMVTQGRQERECLSITPMNNWNNVCMRLGEHNE